MIRIRARTLMGLTLLVAIFACDVNEPEVPVPSDLVLRIATPHPGEGAVLLRIIGPGLSTVKPVRPDYDVHVRTVEGTLRVAVFGQLVPGDLIRFTVPDMTDAERYTVELVEVAGPDNALRPSLNGYSAVVVVP